MQATFLFTSHKASGALARAAGFVFTLLLLQACGGGGSDDSAPTTSNLVVNAGPDVTLTEGVEHTLNATATGGDTTYSYSWVSTPALSLVQSDATSPAVSFTAPEVINESTYVVTVTVNDASGNIASDSTTVTVTPVNVAPVANIVVPQWGTLPANRFPGGVEITLDGSSSSDEDARETPQGIEFYSWSQVAGPNVITGAEIDEPTLTITTPITSDAQSLQFELLVTDFEGATDSEIVTIQVQSETQTLPVVSAGVSQGVFSGEVVILKGEGSTTIPSALPLRYLWERSNNVLPSNTPAIDDSDARSTFDIAPVVTQPTVVAYTLTVTDANGNAVEDTINVRVLPIPTPLLNDTGVVQQSTATALTSAQQNDYPGQDGQRGQDVINKNGVYEKAGRGQASFDFTHLNENGDEQDASVAEWSCVRDNTTGLVWEVKTDDGSFQDHSFTYTWFDEENNGGFAGDETGSNGSCLLGVCNTAAYIAAVNAMGLCGFYDWRLPSHNELFSLMHLGIASGVVVDENYFPNTGTFSSSPLWYWTATSSADGVSGDEARNAWALDFNSGVDNFLNKSAASRVRLVRAGR